MVQWMHWKRNWTECINLKRHSDHWRNHNFGTCQNMTFSLIRSTTPGFYRIILHQYYTCTLFSHLPTVYQLADACQSSKNGAKLKVWLWRLYKGPYFVLLRCIDQKLKRRFIYRGISRYIWEINVAYLGVLM